MEKEEKEKKEEKRKEQKEEVKDGKKLTRRRVKMNEIMSLIIS